MVDRQKLARQRLHFALLARGFKRDFAAGILGGFIYRGVLDPTDLAVPVRLEVADWDFVQTPSIWIEPEYAVSDRNLPHFLGTNRLLCYVARGTIVLDRYNPAGTVLLCLAKAEKLVRDALRGRLDGDFANEFQAYWQGAMLLVDLPQDFEGTARLQPAQVVKAEKQPLVLSTGKTWLRFPNKTPFREPSEDVTVLRVDASLSLNPSANWPPKTLEAINLWLAWTAPNCIGIIETAIARSASLHAHVALCATNGIFLYDVALPNAYRTPEFKSRRKSIPRLLSAIAASLPAKRSEGKRADAGYVFSRNFGSMTTLSGKRILLVGCGTIGSFLAQQLAQCGGGSGSGQLLLVDSGTLEPGNLGRHLLGAPYLNMNKATACVAFLNEQAPALNIWACTDDAISTSSIRWDQLDLVIDATGEEALSIALNQRAVERRPEGQPHLFVWLEGNGSIAQALLADGPEYACYKCLKPILEGQPRFRTMRPNVQVDIVENPACGDPRYRPFPVSRSVAAAALACDLVLDWNNGHVGDHYRSFTLDPVRAFQVPRGSPKPLAQCPACGPKG